MGRKAWVTAEHLNTDTLVASQVGATLERSLAWCAAEQLDTARLALASQKSRTERSESEEPLYLYEGQTTWLVAEPLNTIGLVTCPRIQMKDILRRAEVRKRRLRARAIMDIPSIDSGRSAKPSPRGGQIVKCIIVYGSAPA